MKEKDDIIEEVNAYKELDAINADYQKVEKRLNKLIKNLEKRQDDAKNLISEYSDKIKWTRFQPEYLQNFVEESYVIEPKRFGKGGQVLEWRVYVPKMVKFHVGRLERATHSYNVFSVTQYMHHFADIPEELSSRFPKLDIELKVVDGLLVTDIKDTDTAWSRYKKYLYKREGPGRLQIKKGSEWEIIAQILEDGGLPFVPQTVDKEDFRSRSYGGFACHANWKVRDYQKDAIQKFHEYGAVGIYFPFGTGKSQLGLDLIDQIKGQKLVVVNSITLKEQWIERLDLLPEDRKNEVHVVTYHGFNQIQRLIKQHKEFALTVFDECLPYDEKIYTEYGPIPIGYIVENHIKCNVWSYNFDTQRLELKPITHHFTKNTNSLLELETDSSRIRLTPTHEILLNSGKHLPAKQMQVGDLIVCMQNMWKGIRETPSLRSSHDAPQTSRSQQENIQKTSLEPKASRSMGSFQEEIIPRTPKGEKSLLERWNSPADFMSYSTQRFQSTYGMYGLPRSLGGISIGYSPQGWKSFQQLKRKSHNTLSFMPRKPTPRGWSHYTEVDKIKRIQEIEVIDPIVYDIEIADNHNFFANGILVSNCHHLPAKTFMRLSTIPTKYRLGLTGSPYREDGHINYILALTGYPMGLTWSKFISEGIISLAQIQVHVVKKPRYKLALLDDLLKRDLGKTLIFCDSLDLGADIGKRYGIDWVHGGTKDRMEKIRKNERIIISRVGDEGISIPALDTVIEIDFLGGSRMQALQRAGRLQHRAIKANQEPAVHHILMTEEELDKYNKRLLAYYDKGFKLDYLYHT